MAASAAHDRQPAWSSDRQRIVFVSDRDVDDGERHAPNCLWLATTTAEPRLLTCGFPVSDPTDGDGTYDPAWSPDGSKTAFVFAHAGERRLYLFHVGTEESYPVMEDPQPFRFVLRPTWSPDGSWIAFAGTDFPSGDDQLAVVSPDGNDFEILTRGFEDGDPTWSPDGTRLVFHRGNGGDEYFPVAGALARAQRSAVQYAKR